MEYLGERFNCLRLTKNYTLEKLSKGIMTPSALSKFENGENFVSVENLIKLIKRLNLSYRELGFLLLPQQSQEVEEYLIYIHEDNLSINELIELEIETLNSHEKTNNIRYEHFFLVLKQKNNQINNLEYDKNATRKIRTYLQSLDDWSDYDVFLLKGCIFFLDISYLGSIIPRIIRHAGNIASDPIQTEFYLDMVLQIFERMANDRDGLNYITHNIKNLRHLKKNTNNYSTINRIIFWHKYTKYLKDRDDSKLEKCKKTIDIMEFLGDDEKHSLYQDLYNDLIK